MARRFNVQTHQVRHVLDLLKIAPVSRVGVIPVYAESDAERVGQELARIAQHRSSRNMSASFSREAAGPTVPSA